jgi:hypothetical protein
MTFDGGRIDETEMPSTFLHLNIEMAAIIYHS